MQTAMVKLDGFLRRRRWLVLGAWVAVLVVAVPLAMRQSERLTGGGFNVPGSQSEKVSKALDRDFANAERSRLAVVLVPERGGGPAQLRAAIGRVDRAAGRTDHLAFPSQARTTALAGAAHGTPLIVPLQVDVTADRAQDVAVKLRDRLHIADGARDGVAAHLIGEGALYAGLQDVTKKDLAKAESVGFPVVMLILLAVFGSFAAASLPLLLGLFSVLITGALIFLLSRSLEMSVFVTNMASMIGIGVAVDYSLFVLARYREEVLAGLSPQAARTTAMATSGVAVAFSGLTVIASLAGLWMVQNNALRSMALGAMLVVAVSVLASATLLPVLIQLFGTRAYARNRWFTITGLIVRSRSRRRPGSTHPAARRLGFWERWTAFITRRPVLSVVATATLLLILAIPVLSMKTGTGALRQFPADYEARVGFEKAAAITGPGAANPTQVLARFRRGHAADAANAGAVRNLREMVRADTGIVALGPTEVSRDGRAALFTATPRLDGESPQTKAMVVRLRDRLRGAPPARAADVSVGGSSARQRDVQDMISGSMWKIILFVLGLSYFVLLVLLRSVLLPLKAVLMNLLSVGAAYGVLVVVFQWGWFDGLFGFHSLGFVDTLTPPLVLAVVFGLSMDYEVFLLSRIRERWQVTGDSRRAVAEGLSRSARTITSAALIMASVFAVFIFTGAPSIKELGLGNAVAITLDATIVRLILVPAAMELLGDWNWWLPRRLARVLPRASVERAPQPTAAS